jgi:hypothetical protein
MTSMDSSYAPIVAQYTDDDGRLIGAALTFRAQVAVTTVTAAAMGLPDAMKGAGPPLLVTLWRMLEVLTSTTKEAPDGRVRGSAVRGN